MSALNSVTDLLQALVRIPSVNPFALDVKENPQFGEARCARFAGDFLATLGADIQFEEVLPDRPNLIARFPSRGGNKPRVLFGPHLDTVTVEGMENPFGGEVRDGRLYGRGASDTKGTMAAMLWALHEVGADRLPDLGVEVAFVGFMGEEYQQPGSIHFAKHHHAEHDFAIVGEPTNNHVVYTHKGATWLKLAAKGVAAHGATPELGQNAILSLSRILIDLDEKLRPRLADFPDPALDPSTMNIGQCQGGKQPNIVPDYAEARIDFRVTPALGRYGVVKLVREHLPSDIDIEVILDCDALATDPELPLVQKLAQAGTGQLVNAPWLCDAAHLAAAGIPSVAAGPGSIAQAHTIDEWIAIDELEKGVDFYRAFLESC